MSEMQALAEELREYTAMKYAGDCKCGKCQLVPRALVERIYHTLNGSSVRCSADSAEPVAWRWKVSPMQLNWQYSDAPPATSPVYNLELLYRDPPQTASVNEARDRIIGLIADLQGEHEVMCGRPIDPTAWKIEVPVSDLQALIGARCQAGSAPDPAKCCAHLWACTGCGTRKSMEQIKGEVPQAIACCPERHMAPLSRPQCEGGK